MSVTDSDLARARHDLRTPVNQILGYCDLLLEETGLPPDILRDLERIRVGGRRLMDVVAEYFGETAFLKNRQDVAHLQHDVRTPIHQILGYSEMIQERAVEIGDGQLFEDAGKIHRAAANWLALAERHLQPSSSAATASAASAFEPLHVPGSWVPSGAPSMTGRLLVVDDDPENREILIRRLAREGYQIESAADGVAALEMLRRREFDLVLLDVVLPGLDGFEVLLQLRSDPRFHHLPVVMLSGLDQEASIARCIAGGADDYLTKPFSPLFLRARVGACLEKKRLRDQEEEWIRQLTQERTRSEELLLNILPRAIADRLKQGESPIVDEVGDVSVVFVDLVDFTALSTRIAPQALIAVLNDTFSGLDQLASETGVEKIKTIGDAWMAVAGLFSPSSDHPAAAAEFALRSIELVSEVAARHGLPISAKVGLHCGPVVAGVIGRRKFAYDLWGDTVNTASRMESSGRPGRVHVSADFRERLPSGFEFEERGFIEVKGKGFMPTWYITGRAAQSPGR